jgi:hypothetical protein
MSRIENLTDAALDVVSNILAQAWVKIEDIVDVADVIHEVARPYWDEENRRWTAWNELLAQHEEELEAHYYGDGCQCLSCTGGSMY